MLEHAWAESSENEPDPDCVLCPPLRFRFNAMADLPGEAAVLADDPVFILIPDLAPLADGHLLLVTRDHHRCAGAFDRPTWDRALVWRDRVARLYHAAYGTPDLLMFEHGPARAQDGGACIDHAHWHFLPGVHGVRAVVEAQGRPGTPADRTALRARFRTGRSYLLVEEDGAATVHPGDGAPGQFLRWAVTKAVADPSGTWRWQETFGLPAARDRFLRTVRDLRRAADGQCRDSHQ